MIDDWTKAYWAQLFQKRYWKEVVIGLPPEEPWAPTTQMLCFELNPSWPVSRTSLPRGERMIIAQNEAYLEIADGQYMRRGFGGMVYTLMALPILAFLSMPLTEFLERGVTPWFFYVLAVALALFGPMLWWTGFHWKQDMLGYTCKPMRLVRSTRKLHVFRHNGPGGVWSLDWDKLTFTLKKGGLLWGVLGYLPDENGLVTHAFYLGAHLPVAEKMTDEDPLFAHWEYFRRYMDEGPSGLLVPDELLPIENRREPFLYGVRRLWGMFGPFSVIFLPITTPAALFRWAAMRMSRLPRWPAEVEAECDVTVGEYTEPLRPIPDALGKRVLVGIGTVSILALDAVLLWRWVVQGHGLG